MDTDIIYNKLLTYNQEDNIVYQKAHTLLKTLKSQLGEGKLKGKDGVCRYASNLISLLMIESSSEQQNILNIEAMFLILTVAVKSLEMDVRKFNQKLLDLINVYAQVKNSKVIKNILLILESVLLHRTKEEIESGMDEACFVFESYTLDNLIFSRDKEVTTQLIKSYCKLFKTLPTFGNERILSFSEVAKYSLIQNIVNKIKYYIKSIYGGENDILLPIPNKGVKDDLKNRRLTGLEAESILDFLIAIVQVFPHEFINEFTIELNSLILNTQDENSNILNKTLSVIEMFFMTKSISPDVSENILNTLLESSFFLENFSLNNASVTVSFIKATSQVIICLSKYNFKATLKYLPSFISIIGEIINEDNFDEEAILACDFEVPSISLDNKEETVKSKLKQTVDYIKISTFNSLNLIISKIFSDKGIENINNIFLKNKDKTDIDNLMINQEYDISDYLNNFTAKVILLTMPEYHKDVKPGFALLYSLLEMLVKGKENLKFMIENILQSTSEYYDKFLQENLKEKQEYDNYLTSFKVFFAKLFNIFPASYLSQYLRLDILSYDLADKDFTEISKVWLIALLEKFYKNSGIQTIADYSEFFQDTIKEVLSKIQLLKRDSNATNQVNSQLMMIDEEEMDEKFDDSSDSKHIKQLKISRYELIISQVFKLLPQFAYIKNSSSIEEIEEMFSYIEVISISIGDQKDEKSSSLKISKNLIYKSLQSIVDNLFNSKNKISKTNFDMLIATLKQKEYIPTVFKNVVSYLSQNIEKSTETDIKIALNCLSSLSKILNIEEVLYQIGIEINLFNKSLEEHISQIAKGNNNHHNMIITEDNDSNIAQLNMTLDNNQNLSKDKNTKAIRFNDLKQMSIRVQLINHLALSINITQEIHDILLAFFDNFFFSYTLPINNKLITDKVLQSNEFQLIVRSFLDLAILLVHKATSSANSLKIFSTIWSNNGLKLLSSKQKIKIFSFILNIIITEFRTNESFSIELFKSHFHTVNIIIEIITLTKDINKKVRNSAYDLIADISEFMQECNLFSEWINLLYVILASDDSFIISGIINTFARVFWQEKTETTLLCETAETLLLLLKKENKEINKSLFLFIRILVYIIGPSAEISSVKGGKPINYSLKSFAKMFMPIILKSQINKDFKVKVRNLLKSLMLKLGNDTVKEIVGVENYNYINYINKYIIKKSNKFLTDEEIYYKNTIKSNEILADESIFIDNDDNLIDEEEEFINQEFKKQDKKHKDEEFDLMNVDKWKFDEDDEEERKRKEDLVNSKKVKEDVFDKLFKSSDHDLDNFFYSNPYVLKNEKKKVDKEHDFMNKDKEVYFDKKTHKLVVKDVLDKDSKVTQPKQTKPDSLLKKKRENIDEDLNEDNNKVKKSLDDEIDYLKKYNASNKDINAYTRLQKIENINNLSLKERNRSKLKSGDTKKSHFVKFSGDEYKSSQGKGDKLVKGKFDPFAYIQLNPKAAIDRNNKSNIKVFEKIMRNKN